MTTLILFDIDGTLFFGRGAGRAASKRAMQEVFGAVGNVDNHKYGGKTDWASLLILLAPLGITPEQVEAAMPQYDAVLGAIFAETVSQFPVEACIGGLELVAAVQDRADVMMGIVTGNVRTVAALKLRSVGYPVERFVVGAYGSEASHRDALPPLALLRAEAIHGGPFHQTVIIGDTPDDILCARTIGARTIAVTSGFGARAEIEAEKPDVIFEDLRDTEAVLHAIFG